MAPCMRSRILHSWQPHCRGLQLRQRLVPFSQVRTLSAEDFVAVLAQHLQACRPRCSLPVKGGFTLHPALCDLQVMVWPCWVHELSDALGLGRAAGSEVAAHSPRMCSAAGEGHRGW